MVCKSMMLSQRSILVSCGTVSGMISGMISGMASGIGLSALGAMLVLAEPVQAIAVLDFDLPAVKAEPTATRPQNPGPTSEQALGHNGVVLTSKLERPEVQRDRPLALNFSPLPPLSTPASTLKTWTKRFSFFDSRSLFEGGSNSLVARAVGHAEGTRTATGEITWAYWGHVDPGNQVWNRGTFSYQHAADSPEEADARQLKRLEQQTKMLEQQAKRQGIKLSLNEKLNGIDLANQAPLAALDRGYINRLAEAKQMNLPEIEAILWARTWAYWDPDWNRWNAPGLGNTQARIAADQQRRQEAIARVLSHCPQEYPTDCPVP